MTSHLQQLQDGTTVAGSPATRQLAQRRAPSFNPEAVSREVQAIESEFRETIRDDFSRLDELLYRSAPAGHPFGTFTWGNAESLRQGDASAVAAVKALHDAHYHASNMKLAVVRADQG